MSAPSLTTTVSDGTLGLVPPDNSANTAVIGVCSSGTTEQVYAYSSSDAIDTVKSELGYGPGPEAAAYHLSKDGSTVYVIKADTTGGTAASCSAVVASGGGPAVTVNTATAYDDYQVKILIVAGGAVGTSTFKYSLDGGDTYSATITTAATYVIPNSGITIAFAAGTYVAAEYYTFTSTAATYSTTKMGTAIDAFLNSSYDASLIHIVGRPSGAADTDKATAFQAMVAAVQTKLAAAATSYVYARALVDGPDVANDSTADALLVTAFVSTDASRVLAAAGSCELTSALVAGRKFKRPATWPIVARARQIPISEEPGFVGRGSLGADCRLQTSETPPTKYNDSRLRSTLHDARFATLRTHRRRQGVYVTQARLMSATTSDFQLLPHGRVMDRACAVVYETLIDYINASVRIDSTTGYILEADAKAIESRAEQALRAAITAPGHASDVEVTVNRSTNLLSTPTLKVKIRIVPLSYINAITDEIGFTNPALSVVS